jgi:DNA-binding ferritin-like protein (Dps family)
MNKIINAIIGDLNQKKAYRDNEKRAKALPTEYVEAYKNIKRYIFNTSGIFSMDPLITLVDIFEEAAASKKNVIDITGPDVAAFADELVRGTKSYQDQQRDALNKNMKKK